MSSKFGASRARSFTAFARKPLEKLAAAAALGLAAFGLADQAEAGQLFTGQFGSGNTWNVYEGINTPATFKDALALAAARPDPTGGTTIGHLVTLGNEAENTFVNAQKGAGDKWIGLTDRAGVAPGATESIFQLDALTQGWAWVTGEPFTYQNWNAGEPNNAGTGEDGVHFTGAGVWNDNASGFAENEPALDPPDIGSTAEPRAFFGYVIEWNKNLATQPSGFPATRPDPALQRVFPSPLTRLPGPNGTATTFGVRDFTGNGGAAQMFEAVDKILSGVALEVNGTAARLDINDPDNGGNQGSVTATQVPVPSNIAGADDDNFQEVVKGTITVPAGKGGNYTFNVRSDDGFALRILSQKAGGPLVQHKFTAARTGLVDEDGTLTFLNPTGDSNTQGLINLSPGTYDVEFAWYEDTGGAFAEVSTAQGDYVNGFGAPRWQLLGNGTFLAGSAPFKQAARLKAAATVKNTAGFANAVIQDSISAFRNAPVLTGQSTVNDVILRAEDGIGPATAATISPTRHHMFPNGGGDNFFSQVTGTLTVLDTNNAPGETLTFGLFSDDNAALHIIGQNFTSAVGDGSTSVGTPAGESDTWLVADFATGNTNARGLITLPEGDYNFEAFHLELGGGAGLQVWVAPGDQTAAGFNGGAFAPLVLDALPDYALAANQGLGLVAGPGTGPATKAGDFDGDGDVDGRDFLVWQRGGSPTPNSPADLATWKTNFATAVAAGAAVPEPSTLCLAMAVAGVGAGCARRRK